MDAGVDLSSSRGCHCLAARRYARAITRLFEAKLRPQGLRATQFSVLAALALKGPTPVKELAETLGLERTTLTRIGAVLERNGWVSIAQSDDARERPFRLTGAGRRKLEGAFPAWKQTQDLVDRRLGGLFGKRDDPDAAAYGGAMMTLTDRLIAEFTPKLGKESEG